MKTLSSSDFKSFVYGMMLGDGYVHRNGKEFGCRQIEKTLIHYKAAVIAKNLPTADIRVTEHDAYHDGKWSHQKIYRLRAKHEYFRKIFDRFYDHERKRVDDDILRYVKPNGLAVWHADDGTLNLIGKQNLLSGKADRLTDRRLELCTDGFTLDDTRIIAAFFDRRYGPDSCTLVNRDHKDKDWANPTGFRLRFRVPAAQRLILEIHREFLHYPELLYKLDMGYRGADFESPYCKALPEYQQIFQEISAHDKFIDRLSLP